MAKRNKKQPVDITTLAPDEINALRAVVKEFMDRMQNIDNEISTLRDDKKALVEDYADKPGGGRPRTRDPSCQPTRYEVRLGVLGRGTVGGVGYIGPVPTDPAVPTRDGKAHQDLNRV